MRKTNLAQKISVLLSKNLNYYHIRKALFKFDELLV